ncbi:hypothetical protein V8D89_002656 [Ganoderma adspersum]
MDHAAFYTYSTETPSSSTKDWMGVPGSPNSFNQALMDFEDPPATIPSFDRDIDDALGLSYDFMDPMDVLCPLDPMIDWQSIFNTTMPFPLPVLTDDASSATDTSNQPLSPISDTTLVDSSFSSFLPEFKLAPAGDALVDQPVASHPSALDDFQFTFQYEPVAATPPFDFPPALVQQDYALSNYDYSQGQYWPGQQPSQHAVGAAGAVAPGLATGVEMEVNADAFAFTPIGPTSLPLLPVSTPEPQQVDPLPEKEAKPVRATRKKQPRVDSDVDSSYSAGESTSGDDAPVRKRRKQDTTKRFPCLYEDCDGAFSRTHNLQVHIDSVHLHKRKFACKEPACERSFSRKHDLVRHHQSSHTDLGSPRNNANNAKGAKGRKIVKKDKHDA